MKILEKIKALPKKAKVLLTTASMMCLGSAVAFAEEVPATGMVMGAEQAGQIMTAITTTINVTAILGILVKVIGVAIIFVFMWWGIRKAISAVMGAIRGGSLGV